MTVATLPAELVFPRARVDRILGTGERRRHRRVRVIVLSGLVRIFEHDGSLTLEAKVADGDYTPGSATFTLSTDNGEQWTVTKMGCNCGGGE